MSETVPTVSDTIEVAGKSYKMTYGLMMDLQRVIPNGEEAVVLVMTDSFIRDYIVRRVLTDKKGTVASETELILSEEIDLSMDEVNSILDWAVAHLLHFFVKSAMGLRTQGQILKTLAPLPQLMDGSPA